MTKDDHGVIIMRMGEEHPYSQEENKLVGTKVPKGHPLIWMRRKHDGVWREEWIQPKFLRIFQGEKEDKKDGEDSKKEAAA